MFKRLSVKITFIISLTTIIVGALIAGYMQFRIITEIGRHTTLTFKEQVLIMQLTFSDDQLKGVDVSPAHIDELVNSVQIYDTGFALVQNNDGGFYDTNDTIRQLSNSDRNVLVGGAADAAGEVFHITIADVDYMVATGRLSNGYTVYVLAPTREVNAELSASLIRFVIIFIAAFTLVIFISYRVARPIAEPLISLSAVMRKVTSTGNLKLKPDDLNTIERLSKIPDETGQLARDIADFVDYVVSVSNALETMASGDLTHDVELKSEHDTIGVALKDTFAHLSSVFNEIQCTTAEVTRESKNIAEGAQSLASGSVEQAASVEELSSSVQDIAGKTKDNSALASKAATLSDSIRESAEKGSRQMNDMMTAVGEINSASKEIGKIIKTIDDIAFQTNILALNAAVEAARAGQHGKGFAVVAEEVRNLASKSAEAARDTGTMIQNSIEKAEYGSCIAGETASSLDEIVNGINETTQLVSDIAKASQEQSLGIEQINVGIDQVAQVVSLNSATAQQSAGVSEKLSGQSSVLEELISQFKTKNSDNNIPRLN